MTTRIFLGFQQPALHSATDYLAQQFRRGAMLAMDGVTVVVPTSRAERRLQTLLANYCQTHQLGFVPPQVVTVSYVPELLYSARLPFASVQTQQMAWAKALRDAAQLHDQLVPAANRFGTPWGNRQWLDAGRVFWRMYRELAAEGLSFADVAKITGAWAECPDVGRWNAMSQLQEGYWQILRDLQLWDQQSARLIAVRSNECRTDRDLVLVGTSDMNRTLRSMLRQVSDRVTSLVHATELWKDRFDELGVLKSEAWETANIDLLDSQWTVADNPESQAEAAVDWLASVAGSYSIDETVVGCPDAQLVPYVQRQLAGRGVRSRWAAGQAMPETAPYLLLLSIRDWISRRHREDFAKLVRHPDVADWLLRNRIGPGWLEALDKYHEEHLSRTYGPWWAESPWTERVRTAFDLVEHWLRVLDDKDRPLGEWMTRLQGVLREVYAKQFLNRDDPVEQRVLSASHIVATEIGNLAMVPAQVAERTTASEAIDLVLAGIETKVVSSSATADSIDILGWLDLPLDDTRALVVGGIHEGTVPRATTSGQFLPNTLRERLGIDDAHDRYARDAYALSALLAGNREVHFVVGRSTVEGDPLRPSRLLLAAEGDELVRRWDKLLKPRRPQPWHADSSSSGSRFQIPRPNEDIELSDKLTVSGFKMYLQCPYRFYLSHVLKLRRVDDSSRELDARQYGTVIHRVLDCFGKSEYRDSTDIGEITEFCRDALGQVASEQFADLALPPVQIQLAQICGLLNNFAVKQAERSAEGWRIRCVETHCSFPFIVDDVPTNIEGRIDRIDQHQDTGEWVILDYKTSAAAKDAATSHRKKDGQWLDLQLPLYRHIATSDEIRDPQVGYFSLPVSESCKISLLEWTADQFQEADEKIKQVIRDIRQCRFWPPNQPNYRDEWEDICMVGLLERPDLCP